MHFERSRPECVCTDKLFISQQNQFPPVSVQTSSTSHDNPLELPVSFLSERLHQAKSFAMAGNSDFAVNKG
jgi:hypothetical protein